MSCEFNSAVQCSCTAACPLHGKCCECVARHRDKGQFPGCFFSAEAEKKYNRGFALLLEDRR